jgi:hypothetical protein
MRTFLIVLALAIAIALGAGPVLAASTPAVGTAASDVNLSVAPGTVAYGSGWAVPLKGARPAWYTAELAARVYAANGVPVAAPTDAPLPSEIGIRPGSWMIEPYGCTMNFVFSSGADLAIGTAGHCVDNARQHVVLLTLAPNSANPVLVDIGTAIARKNGGVGNDFALISIRPELYPWVSATAAVVAGPCGSYAGSGPETVWHYGHGVGIGTGGTPRAGVALTWQADAFGWDGAAIFGDSGSAVRVTDLSAAGDLTHLVVDTNWLPSFIAGTRMSRILEIANGWSLVSSPLCL